MKKGFRVSGFGFWGFWVFFLFFFRAKDKEYSQSHTVKNSTNSVLLTRTLKTAQHIV